jgi:3-hydroxybutyryl-CoA dehydratase
VSAPTELPDGDDRELPPGEYWFEDLQAGDFFLTDAVAVTAAQITAFAELSGDFFAVHLDDEFARAQGFPSRIAHGLLVLSLVDGLKNRSAVKLMAVASLGWDWKFRAPVVAGDHVRARVRVVATRISSKGLGVVTLALTATKQDDQIVQEGETTLILRHRPSPPASGTAILR